MKWIVRSWLSGPSTRAISSTPAVPLALSSAPGATPAVPRLSKCPPTTMYSSGFSHPVRVPTTFLVGLPETVNSGVVTESPRDANSAAIQSRASMLPCVPVWRVPKAASVVTVDR